MFPTLTALHRHCRCEVPQTIGRSGIQDSFTEGIATQNKHFKKIYPITASRHEIYQTQAGAAVAHIGRQEAALTLIREFVASSLKLPLIPSGRFPSHILMKWKAAFQVAAYKQQT